MPFLLTKYVSIEENRGNPSETGKEVKDIGHVGGDCSLANRNDDLSWTLVNVRVVKKNQHLKKNGIS